MMDAGAVIAGSVAVVAGIVWVVRIEGRVNLGEERYSSLKADIEEIKADVKKILWNGHQQ